MSKAGAIVGDMEGKVALRLARLHKDTSKIPVEKFTSTFEDCGVDVVVFAAGAGGKGGPARIKAVGYLGALKVFDAIETVERAQKPRLPILISAIDIRDPNKIPDHYNEADIKYSRRAQPVAVHYREFKWTIVRPGILTDYLCTNGKAAIGKTHITDPISRDDVANTIALLVDRPNAAGLGLDVIGGETPLAEALNVAIKNRVTAWVG